MTLEPDEKQEIRVLLTDCREGLRHAAILLDSYGDYPDDLVEIAILAIEGIGRLNGIELRALKGEK